ncbi:MAG: PIG-L family deacetylase [Acidimicrobiales bacterium]
MGALEAPSPQAPPLEAPAPEAQGVAHDGAPRRCLLTVHAHPDDESEFGGASVARYHHEGVRTVLVCCTDGGSGRILNPEFGPVGDRTNIVQIRRQELKEAAAIVGYDEVVMLGYADSGSVNLPDEERSPTCFARVPLEGPLGRVVELIRRVRPQVIVSYPEDQRVYPHPDHLRAHEVAVRAFALAGDRGAFPAAGPVWQPLKLYYTVTSRERRRSINEKYEALGMDAPFTAREGAGLQGRGDPELAPDQALVTTRLDVAPFAHKWIQGMRAHRCQLKPALAQTLSIDPGAVPDVYGTEEYILARDLTAQAGAAGGETDLFAGVE